MPLTIRPTAATLGATLTGVDLAALDDVSWREIEDAFHEYAVLIFPDQNLAAQAQIAFAQRFGDIEIIIDALETIPVSNKGLGGKLLADDSHRMQLLRGNEDWHTDSSYMPLSAKASVLSAHVVPSAGGQTEWADMRAAYDALDDAMKDRVGTLVAYHSYIYSQAKIGHNVAPGAGYGFFDGEPPLRPLLKVHPVTGRTALYIGRHAYGIAEIERGESEQLLHELMALSCQPPRTLSHTWQPGDIVVWDNRCVLHRARPFDHREERVMMHTRIKGDPATESALNA
ncbi:MAG: TauD/TfdA family dioxygenase [Proteobacteria bacterium]|nr:MAG: TauD/TfdA family dioxygenase [Pseudomonadota bacterium]